MKYRPAVIFSAAILLCAACAGGVRVMTTGLGDGRIESSPAGINCTDNCSRSFPRDALIQLIATPLTGSTFTGWGGDCTGNARSCMLRLDSYKSVIANFNTTDSLPFLTDGQMNGEGIRSFVVANPRINTAAKFIAALRYTSHRYADNWLLMSKSESLQTGIGFAPRLLLPSQDATRIFAFSLKNDPDFPHADTSKIEFIEFDAASSRFRFHEINIEAGTVTVDATSCTECHYGRPNWDTYDSWGGMLPYNRDRIYKGSIEAAALRYLFNLWSHSGNQRDVIERLNLPPGMERIPGGGLNGGRVRYPSFDGSDVVFIEPRVSTSMVSTVPLTSTTSNWPTTGAGTTVYQRGDTIVLRNSGVTSGDEGRGVDLFDLLTPMNARRIARDLAVMPTSRIDVRPIAYAIAAGCALETMMTPADAAFFNARNRVGSFAAMQSNTRDRQKGLAYLKADLQFRNLTDPKGLIAAYGSQTPDGSSTNDPRVRQELFRRPIDNGAREELNAAVPLLNDIESYSRTVQVARYRYFLEPLGVDVDKWSLSVHGRARTYTFADLFQTYNTRIVGDLAGPLGLAGAGCTAAVQSAVRTQFNRLPSMPATPTFAEVQRIFTRNCLECHGSFRSIPGTPTRPILVPGSAYAELVPRLVVGGDTTRSLLFTRIKSPTAPMPPVYNGPPLTGSDIDIIRRWIQAGAPR